MFAVVLLLFSAVFAWVISDYKAVRAQISNLGDMESENRLKSKQLILLAQRVERVNRKVSNLKEFDLKLKGMVSTRPEDKETQMRGIGGTDFPYQAHMEDTGKGRILPGKTPRRLRDSDTQGESLAEEGFHVQKFLEEQKIGKNHIPSIWPVKGWLVRSFGYRQNAFGNGREFSSGIDIAARAEAPILATAEGMVSNVEWHSSSGWAMNVNHGNGIVTRYSNLEKIIVKKGSCVTKGEPIAFVSGDSRNKGSKLHYEVFLNRLPVNPVCYLPR
jgi:murein DD-endopeptidase MepM/ murein hydrolase activator NlpD